MAQTFHKKMTFFLCFQPFCILFFPFHIKKTPFRKHFEINTIKRIVFLQYQLEK
jgi:hypothetical protein